MSKIELYSYSGSAVRVVMLGDPPAPWWVAKDVCDILGYANVTDTLNKHLDDDERNTLAIREGTSPKGGNPNMNIISESGLYCLIMRSEKPQAKEFRKWVTSEVLPSIRKTGSYSVTEQMKPTLPDLVLTAKIMLEVAGIKDNQLALALDSVAESYTGKSLLALSGVTLIAPNNCPLLTPTEIGKHFGISGRKVNKILCEEGYQQREGNSYIPLEAGEPFAVMLDTRRKHSDGTPVHQLKWEAYILDEVADLMGGVKF